MMHNSFLTLTCVAGLSLGLGLIGCANDGGDTSADSVVAGSRASDGDAVGMAMMCPGCETVWTRQHVGKNRGGIYRYSSGRQMVCETCDTTARTYLKDGKPVIHNCPDCKVEMVPVTRPPAPANPKGPR